jgi:hypothetical protein
MDICNLLLCVIPHAMQERILQRIGGIWLWRMNKALKVVVEKFIHKSIPFRFVLSFPGCCSISANIMSASRRIALTIGSCTVLIDVGSTVGASDRRDHTVTICTPVRFCSKSLQLSRFHHSLRALEAIISQLVNGGLSLHTEVC